MLGSRGARFPRHAAGKVASSVLSAPLAFSGEQIEFAQTEDRKLRGSLRNPVAIEAAVTALQIAALKVCRYGRVSASVCVSRAKSMCGVAVTYGVSMVWLLHMAYPCMNVLLERRREGTESAYTGCGEGLSAACTPSTCGLRIFLLLKKNALIKSTRMLPAVNYIR